MSLKTNKIQYTSKDIFSLDSTSNSISNPETLNTVTQGIKKFTLNPFYSCKCRRGYSLASDPFNEWRKQIEPVDYSRRDIAFSYRIRRGY
ncbi:MAG TPA: hypothetical protein VGK06_08285 [Methanosarcina sp.]